MIDYSEESTILLCEQLSTQLKVVRLNEPPDLEKLVRKNVHNTLLKQAKTIADYVLVVIDDFQNRGIKLTVYAIEKELLRMQKETGPTFCGGKLINNKAIRDALKSKSLEGMVKSCNGTYYHGLTFYHVLDSCASYLESISDENPDGDRCLLGTHVGVGGQEKIPG